MTRPEAIVLLKDMRDHGVFYKQYEDALDMAVKEMERGQMPACNCGNEIVAYCTKCGGYVPVRQKISK